LAWPFGPTGKLLLLTGARRDEIAGMRWNEIDREAKTWTLPASRTKNKRTHEVPLSDPAMTLIDLLPRVGDRIDFVFSTTGRTAVSGLSGAKDAINSGIVERLREARGDDLGEIGAADRVLHDLRRTVATNLKRSLSRKRPCQFFENVE
jgi:integrase